MATLTFYHSIPNSTFIECVEQGIPRIHVFTGGRLVLEEDSPAAVELKKIADKPGSPVHTKPVVVAPDMDIAKQETVKAAEKAIDKIVSAAKVN